ncbi:hypothetical protein, partial [Elizabethkingia miricola]|uniref:hypothetical protein n=1 Tax=Elizabethkingia miricola TaxID=172045 RepID=UPI001CA42EFF
FNFTNIHILTVYYQHINIIRMVKIIIMYHYISSYQFFLYPRLSKALKEKSFLVRIAAPF